MAYSYELEHFCELNTTAAKAYSAIHNEPIEKNLGDVTQVDFGKMQGKVTAIFGGSPCFPAGTKVTTDKGFVNIEDIRVGDKVLTHNNRYMNVDRIGGIHEEPITGLLYSGGLSIYATGYHPFHVKRAYESVAEKIYLRDIKQGYYVACIINTENKQIYDLSADMWRLLGCCVGAGQLVESDTKQYYIRVRLRNEQINDFSQAYGNYEILNHNNGIYEVAVRLPSIVDILLNDIVGNCKGFEEILNAVLSESVEHIKAFLSGFADSAEGHIDGAEWVLNTKTKETAMLLCSMVHKVFGVGCHVVHTRYGFTLYRIHFKPSVKEDRRNWFIQDGKMWYRVDMVFKTCYIAPTVYNIEVNTDHTYIADNLVVYNCQDFSNSGTKQGAVWTCNSCGYAYNPMSLPLKERHSCPECGGTDLQHTRSSLLQYFIEALLAIKPNFAVYENVSALTSSRYSTVFKRFQFDLEDAGYCYETVVLNCADFGIPQSRERVFVVFMKNTLAKPILPYIKPIGCVRVLGDYLERDYKERKYASELLAQRFQFTDCTFEKARCGTTIGEDCHCFGQRYVVYHENSIVGTLTASDYKNPVKVFVNDGKYTKFANGAYPLHAEDIWLLDTLECFRLMGFSDRDYQKAKESGPSRVSLYQMAGNSIAVNVLFYLFKALYCSNPALFADVRVLSLFSGIGAFEKALTMFMSALNSGKDINEIEFEFDYYK